MLAWPIPKKFVPKGLVTVTRGEFLANPRFHGKEGSWQARCRENRILRRQMVVKNMRINLAERALESSYSERGNGNLSGWRRRVAVVESYHVTLHWSSVLARQVARCIVVKIVVA